jgi:UPF0755 protein
MNKRLGVILSMLSIWLFGLAIYAVFQLNAPLKLTESVVVSMEKGRPLSSFFTKLEDNEWLDDGRWIMLVAKLTGKARLARAGDYELNNQMNALDVLDLILKGKTVQYKITLIEGQGIKEVLRRIAEHDKIRQDLPSDLDEMMELLGLTGHPEGRFFPDTYLFDANTRASTILTRAQVRLESVLAQEWQNKEENLPYKNSYEALIMASIVEKETAAPEEREQIAGVFVRRLEKRMRLETDPTVIYGLGDRYKGNIRRKHLKERTPYNTYRIKGLPPTPIALVGREAIYAALHPSDGEELYFVAKGNGRHYFSSNLAEHNKAVREYQIKKRVKQYRSTPEKVVK